MKFNAHEYQKYCISEMIKSPVKRSFFRHGSTARRLLHLQHLMI